MLAPANVSSRELELKWEMPREDFRRLQKSPLVSAFAESKARRTLKSVYFDSPGYHLHDTGIFLRLRNDGGDTWLQTIKAGGELKCGLSDVAEIEVQVESCEPDLERIDDKRVRGKIEKVRNAEGLNPVFETVIDRTTYLLQRDGCAAELAFDEGSVEADGKKAKLREVELELLSGSLEDLLAIAKELLRDSRVCPSAFSKAERGFRLLKGQPVTLDARHSREVTLRRGEPAKDALAKILQSAADQIIANQRVVMEDGTAEGVHQMRIGLTRLRAALRSFKPYTDAPWVDELESNAGNVARVVGRLRDADVLIEDIFEPIAAERVNVPGFAALRQALKAHRLATRKEVLKSLIKALWSHLLLTLTLSPHLLRAGGKLNEPIQAVAHEIMEKRWRKARKYGGRLATLDPEERHSMRKALKKLRYNCEFFQAIYGGGSRSFIKRLKKMQQLFGSMNDVRLAQGAVQIAISQHGEDPAPIAAAGYVLGRHEANLPHVWRKAQREWERLENASGFWR